MAWRCSSAIIVGRTGITLLRKGLLKFRTRGRETKIKYPLKSGRNSQECGSDQFVRRKRGAREKEDRRRKRREDDCHTGTVLVFSRSSESTFFHALATECKSNRRGNLKPTRSCWRTCKLVRERRRHRRPASAPRGVNEIPRRWKDRGRTWN